MKDLALDAWHDLKHRRLLPVAIALGIALIAVPVLLLKGQPEAVKPPLAKPDSSGATVPVVNKDGSSLAGSSKLGSFDRRDPFRSPARLRPPARLAESAQASADGAASGPEGGPAGVGGDDLGGGDLDLTSGEDPMAAGGGAGGGDSPGSDTASGAGSGGSGGGGGGSPKPPASPGPGSGGSGGDGSGDPTPPPSDPRFFEYVAEVDFGRIGDERRYDDVRVLDSLPSERNPVVVYLGQTRSDESAFLVNQAIGQYGEGNCVPNRDSCNIVYLRPTSSQDDHYFRTGPPDDLTYHLRLIAVRRKLDSGDASARSRAESSQVRTRVRGAESKRTVRRTAFDFRIPLIAGQRR